MQLMNCCHDRYTHLCLYVVFGSGLALAIAGCGNGGSVPDAGDSMVDMGLPGPDSAPDAPACPADTDVAHVPVVFESPGVLAIAWDNNVTLDTNSTIVPGSVTELLNTRQESELGPDLAVLRVDSLTIEQGATVMVTGDRPLVIIASGPVRVDGTIDAAANRDIPGPGGNHEFANPGGGQAGTTGETFDDNGAGGAGSATPGGNGGCGGNCNEPGSIAGGPGGVEFGDAALTTLVGGASGGNGGTDSNCRVSPGGAGGGAIQIYSRERISIAGGINVGGGGGYGGVRHEGDCPSATGGAGGRSGGAIFLQAPVVDVTGTLSANGGGGGGSGANQENGMAGENGALGDVRRAAGTRLTVPGAVAVVTAATAGPGQRQAPMVKPVGVAAVLSGALSWSRAIQTWQEPSVRPQTSSQMSSDSLGGIHQDER